MSRTPFQLQVRTDATIDQIERWLLKTGDRSASIELAGSDADLCNVQKSQLLLPSLASAFADATASLDALCIDSFSGGDLAHADRAARHHAGERVKQILASAGEQGIGRVSVAPATVSANRPDRVIYQDALNRTAHAFDRLVTIAERSGVTICVQPSCRGFLTSPPETREWVELIGSSALGIDLDLEGRSDQAHWHDWLTTLEPHVRVLGVRGESEDHGRAVTRLASVADEARGVVRASAFRGDIVARGQPAANHETNA